MCFLLVIFSLHKQRKVTRSPKGRESLGIGFSCCCCCCQSQSQSQSKVQVQVQSFRPPSVREHTFLCLCKERWPKESTPCLRAFRAARSRFTPLPGFFDDTSLYRRKTTCVLHVAPCGVLSVSSVAAEGDPVDQRPEPRPEPRPKPKLPLPSPPLACGKGRGLKQQQGASLLSQCLNATSPGSDQTARTVRCGSHHRSPTTFRCAARTDS